MKKLISFIALCILFSGCVFGPEREDYYVFSFDGFTITPGYDDVEYMKVIFGVKAPEMLEAHQVIEGNEVYFWDHYLAEIDIENDSKKEIPCDQAVVKKIIFYLSNYPDAVYKIGDTELSQSIRENCNTFNGEYIQRNGHACAFGQEVGGKKNIVILYGDLFAVDQDKLHHVEIYVE